MAARNHSPRRGKVTRRETDTHFFVHANYDPNCRWISKMATRSVGFLSRIKFQSHTSQARSQSLATRPCVKFFAFPI